MGELAIDSHYRRAAARTRLTGLLLGAAAVMLGFFGVLGGWAATAPLAGAAVAPGVVRVEDNRQTVQHRNGGVVSAILVAEGDLVEAGQILFILDATEADATLAILQSQLDQAVAKAARLAAERDGLERLEIPSDLSARLDEPAVAKLVAAQGVLLAARRSAARGEEAIAEQQVAQLEQQQAAHRGQIESLRRQLSLIGREAEGVRMLHSRGHAPLTRVVALERQLAALEGELASRHAALGALQEQVRLTGLDLAQSRFARAEEIATELDVQGEQIRELVPRLRAATDERRRTELRAPKAGRVVDLAVFTVGGVVGAGERILDIVPERSRYLIEAELDPRDVARVSVGAVAEVRLPALPKGRERLEGRVALISADRTVPDHAQRSFYRLLVRLDVPAGTALTSGMGATVTVPTEARTLLEYLLIPLKEKIGAAMRER